MKIGKKEVLKWIKKESEKLPDMYYKAYHKYSHPAMENVAEEGEEPNLQPILGYEQKHKVNHARRIKRVWKRYGIEEVNRYFNLYGFQLIEKEEI